MNRPQSFSMLVAQLDMTGYSANYLLGKRLACVLKGDVSLAEDCFFCQCTASGCLGGGAVGAQRLTGTQRQLFIGILEPLCLSCCTIECIDFVTKLMKHAFSSQCQGRALTVVMEALSNSREGKKNSRVRT